MVLKYTRMRENEAKEYLDRVRLHYGSSTSVRKHCPAAVSPKPAHLDALQQGIEFEQVRTFFRCLRMIDDIEMALSLFHSGGGSVTKGKRAAGLRGHLNPTQTDLVPRHCLQTISPAQHGRSPGSPLGMKSPPLSFTCLTKMVLVVGWRDSAVRTPF